MSPAGRSASRKWALKPIRSPGRPGSAPAASAEFPGPTSRLRGDDDGGRGCLAAPASLRIGPGTKY